jgi:hypothetical protein
MSGYLDTYGAADQKREKTVHAILKWGGLILAVALVVWFVFHFVIPNRSERADAKRFFQLLEARDYKQAYAMWGCTDAKPCPSYPFESFMQDWGPQATPVTSVDVLDGESCGSGVIVDVDAGKAGDRKLWVERKTGILGSLPPNVAEIGRCPQGNRIYDWVRGLRYKMHGKKFQ